MKIFDPYAKPPKKPQAALLFADGQLQGQKQIQEDAVAHFGDECFVIADGVGSLPHADVAARLACETAVWAYKHVRQRPYYWSEKPKFLQRIFRTTNLTLWQKQRDRGFTDGLATALAVLLVGPKNFWVGSAGNCSALLYREGLIDLLTREDIDQDGNLTKALGFKRLGLVPSIHSEQLLPGDTILLATDGVVNFVDEDEMRKIFETIGETVQSMSDAVIRLLQTAEKNGSDDNMSAVLVKQIIREE